MDSSFIQQIQRCIALAIIADRYHGVKLDLSWLKTVIEHRINSYFDNKHVPFEDIHPPALSPPCNYYNFLKYNGLEGSKERLLVIMAMCEKIAPQILDIFLSRNEAIDQPYTEFGGVYNGATGGFSPTLQTVQFLIGGGDIASRMELISYFSEYHPLLEFRAAGAHSSANLVRLFRLTDS